MSRRSEGWSSPDKRVPEIPRVEHVTDDEMDRARRAVCSHANDTADARMLLSALGLDGEV
jgi:hypothetical protein